MEADPCVYVKQFLYGSFIILLLYVDDTLDCGTRCYMICRLKEELSKCFDMKDLGPTKQILSMDIFCNRKTGKSWSSQKQYIEQVLDPST